MVLILRSEKGDAGMNVGARSVGRLLYRAELFQNRGLGSGTRTRDLTIMRTDPLGLTPASPLRSPADKRT
ncbi:hypothetical protein OCUBac02_51510 (plasmid) [Bosea sp. ANAM02]|nr:hypothetical protein OCUBac02_51510 [Bosea sp. ANAM02]